MKKTRISLTLILVFCFLFLLAPITVCAQNLGSKVSNEDNVTSVTVNAKNLALAETSVDKISESNRADYEMERSLFKVLLELARRLTNGDYGTIKQFDANVFNVNLHDKDTYYDFSETDGEAIYNDLQNGILNLSTGENAKYACLAYSNFNITESIRGLNALNLNNINTIILDNNKIPEISNLDFASLGNLSEIRVASNGLTSFSLNTGLKYVNKLNLSNNNLKQIDLTRLNSSSGKAPEVDLSCNKIENISDIKFNVPLGKFDISFNNLNNLTQEDIEELNSHMVEGKKANILIQGTTDFSSLYAGDEVEIYQGGEIADLNAKIYYSANSEFSSNLEPIFETDNTGDGAIIKMPAGKIRIEFYGKDMLICSENAEYFSELNESIIEKLSNENEYKIPIRGVTYKGYVGEEEVSSLSQSKNVTVKLFVDDVDNIPNKDDILSGAKFYYLAAGKGTTESNTITVTSNGTFNYFAYLTFDGIQSSTRASIQVVRRDLSAITTGIIIIIIIFVVCAAIFFVVVWVRNGAQVAPLSEKEIFRINKRKGNLAEKNNREDYIANLDAPRHDTRVSDLGYSDNILEEDLNSDRPSYDRGEDFDEVKPTSDFPEDLDD